MRVFVTGADGLLGSNLVRELLARGHEVRALILPVTATPTLDGLPIERQEGNLLDGEDALLAGMNGCDAVYHCAAITDLWAEAAVTWRVNVEGTRRVLEACLAASIKRLIFVGSASSFMPGMIARPGDETGAFPEAYRGTTYIESKHRAAALVREYVRERGLDAVIVAPTFLLGPYDARPSGGEVIRQFLAHGLPFTSRGGRCFAYAPDVAQAMVAAFEKGRKGETYILGGANHTYREFFGKVARIAATDGPRITLPDALIRAAGQASSWLERVTGSRRAFNATIARLSLLGTYYSSAKAIEELGMPQTPIETAIETSIGALRKYGHLDLDPDRCFSGKVALVTGASRGVGAATARGLALRGAKVVITARGEARLQDTRERIERLGGEVEAVAGDVGDPSDAQRMASAAVERFGRIDMVVNNAGVSMRGRFEELAPDVCERVVHTNLMGCLYVTQAALPSLVAAQGHVVFISSIAGLFGLPGASVYCATKKALTGLTESLRLELIPKGVHVGVVYLGFTEHDPEKRILAADGALTPPDRPAHHTQAHAARLILKLIHARKRQVVMTPAGVLGGVVYRVSPGFVEWAVLKAQASQWGVFKRFS